MNIQKFLRLTFAALMALVALPMLADDDDYNPDSPAEPNQYYAVTLSADPAGCCYISGGGRFMPGTSVTVSTSAKNTSTAIYQFLYWELDGEQVSTSSSYTFTMPEKSIKLVAHYENVYVPEDPWEGYDPSNPSEPSYTNPKHALYLTTNLTGSCSFNIASGNRYVSDTSIQLYANYSSTNYKFLGWYRNGVLVSDVNKFNYLMPDEEVTLEAMFEEIPYNPENPGEPDSEQEDVQTQTYQMGDVNGDGVVNITDAVAVINHYLNKEVAVFHEKQGDFNGDGIINLTDAVAIINKYLNKN